MFFYKKYWKIFKKPLTYKALSVILLWRSEDSRWVLARKSCRGHQQFLLLIVFVLLRLDAGAFFMSVLIIRVEVKNTHA